MEKGETTKKKKKKVNVRKRVVMYLSRLLLNNGETSDFTTAYNNLSKELFEEVHDRWSKDRIKSLLIDPISKAVGKDINADLLLETLYTSEAAVSALQQLHASHTQAQLEAQQRAQAAIDSIGTEGTIDIGLDIPETTGGVTTTESDTPTQ